MVKTLWISLAQVATAVVVANVCLTASSALRTGPPPDFSDGEVLFFLAALVLTPLSSMIIGPLVAGKLDLAKPGVYSLSALAAFVLTAIGARTPGVMENVDVLSLILTTLNLALGYGTGIWRERPRRI
ncbi:hypothetical protein [Glycomyces rhizosphaerae]|uniref:Uncharacterized protein n=1 Tax=Glycomyces rhizosphaerae TaxID=2054422 RepID=A0ABV7PX63_9ACTN